VCFILVLSDVAHVVRCVFLDVAELSLDDASSVFSLFHLIETFFLPIGESFLVE
jgi:hypothetical protein